MDILLPPALEKGDKIVIISPSSALADASIVEGAKQTLEKWGFSVEVAPHALGKAGHFAGTDDERRADLTDALRREDVKCILCSRGGYGAMRLLEEAELTLLQKHPKWLIGFSDITALHASITNQGCCSLHAPMAKALAHSHSQKSTLTAMKKILMGTGSMTYEVKANKHNISGEAEGRLFGGNLSLLYALQGTPYQFSIEKGDILFIEDLSEKLYHIDRMMHNLRLSGMLGKIGGLIVGTFSDITPNPNFGQTLEEIMLASVKGYNIPVCFGFPVGHEGKNVPLIEGARVRLTVNAEKSTLVQK